MALPSRSPQSNTPSRHFDFAHIEAFREVAERGNLTSAALALQLSKSTVSKYMTALESQVGVKLLNRTTRSVSLTDAGWLLLERSNSLVELAQRIRFELTTKESVQQG
jgi:DNA-binding transcriptional LysR family regulator